jgi:endonuclease/exonuclease/phosphatase family metal-dependent hydrolase
MDGRWIVYSHSMSRFLLFLAFLLPLTAADPVRIRVVTANLSSGAKQSYDPGHGARILQGLKPDIVLIQEFNIGDNSEPSLRRFVTSNFGADFVFFREKTGPGRIPNGVISRFPILASGFWDDQAASNREFVFARIDIPGNRDLWILSVHLLTDDRKRPNEAATLAALIQRNVPDSAYLVLGGDLNTDNMRDQTFVRLRSVVEIPAALPADGAGKTGTNRDRGKPYDHVLADRDLHPLRTPVVIGTSRFENGLVFDSRVFNPLSAVAPVQRGDSNASNMQHMAVVRDFLIPVP